MTLADAPQPLVDIRGLTKVFSLKSGLLGPRRSLQAVSDVSFSVARGEVLGLVGESGSGKTTIGRCVLRLMEPTSGEIRFDGTDVRVLSKGDLKRFRRRMQIIFQDPYSSLNPRMRVGNVIDEVLLTQTALDKAQRAARALELFGLVGLPDDALRRYPHEFSGGQRQRVGIARALAANPEFIVADEPVSALDVSVQAQVLNLIKDLQQTLGLTMLFVSHDLATVEYLCDRVIVLYLGRIMEVADTASLYNSPQHPYTEALLSAAPVPDPDATRNKIVLKGEIPSPMAPPSGCPFRTRCPYAIERCAQDVPTLREVRPGHFKACIRDDLPTAHA